MTTAVVVLVVLGLVANIATGIVMTKRRAWLPKLTRHHVAVVTTTGTLRGVLAGVYPDCIVLAHAQLLGEPPTPLEGDVLIPRQQIRFLQDVPAPEVKP